MHKTAQRIAYGLALLLVLALLLFSTSSFGRRLGSAATSPFVSLWQRTWMLVSSGVNWILPQGGSRDTERMRQEMRLRELEVQLAEMPEIRRQNAELRQLLSLAPLPGWRALTAEVIARDPMLWEHGFSINKGLADGVLPGALVLSGSDVVGRVCENSRHTSRVATVVSPECHLSLVLSGSDITGISRGLSQTGRQQALFALDYLPKDVPVHSGQQLLTTGLGGWGPAGLPVGEVVPNEQGVLLEVVEQSRGRLLGRPLAELAVLRFVTVLSPDMLEAMQ